MAALACCFGLSVPVPCAGVPPAPRPDDPGDLPVLETDDDDNQRLEPLRGRLVSGATGCGMARKEEKLRAVGVFTRLFARKPSYKVDCAEADDGRQRQVACAVAKSGKTLPFSAGGAGGTARLLPPHRLPLMVSCQWTVWCCPASCN